MEGGEVLVDLKKGMKLGHRMEERRERRNQFGEQGQVRLESVQVVRVSSFDQRLKGTNSGNVQNSEFGHVPSWIDQAHLCPPYQIPFRSEDDRGLPDGTPRFCQMLH